MATDMLGSSNSWEASLSRVNTGKVSGSLKVLSKELVQTNSTHFCILYFRSKLSLFVPPHFIVIYLVDQLTAVVIVDREVRITVTVISASLRHFGVERSGSRKKT